MINLSKDAKDKVIAVLKTEIDNHFREIESIKQYIANLEGNSKPVKTTKMAKSVKQADGKMSLRSFVEDLFKDNRPRTTREIMSSWSDYRGTEVKFSSFSSQLSVLAKNAIKKATILENPIDSRFYYGLPSMFNGNNLKTECLNKIIAP